MLSAAVATGRHDLAASDLFAGLDPGTSILLAVSGGPDSMALMHLASRQRDGFRLAVATVDHGLRPAAKAEAAFVRKQAAALGLEHAILTWEGPRPTTRIQERARHARYGLLADHARRLGATILVTAHHADDQAETIMLRLGRGSGIGGLAGMRRAVALAPGVTLLRPLLDIPKASLVAYCAAIGKAFVEDPSNADPAFARVRLRAQAEMLVALGLGPAGLLRLARRMARADAALEAETVRVEAGLTPTRGPGTYETRLTAPIEPEILIRLVRRAIEHAKPGEHEIRLERLEGLVETIGKALASGTTVRLTLAGTRIVLSRDGSLVVDAAPARRRGVALGSKPASPPGAGVKAELTRPHGSLGKTEGAAYIG